MDLELWHLILLPVLFAAGWISRGVEKRQNEAEVTQTPEAYSQGVTLLLAGKEEKAIDCFIEAVRLEPERTDLHFILGRLFRGRGEFARAIRVHESLMNNADLPTEDRVEAIRALAEDFMTAGLFDRAEEAYRMLADIPNTHGLAPEAPRLRGRMRRRGPAHRGAFAPRLGDARCHRARGGGRREGRGRLAASS